MVWGGRAQGLRSGEPCSLAARARVICMAGCVALVKSLFLSEPEISHGLKQSSKPGQDEKTIWETEASR